MGTSGAETLDLVTSASLGEECLEDVDLNSGLKQTVRIKQDVNKVRDSYTAIATTPILSRTAYQNNRLNNM